MLILLIQKSFESYALCLYLAHCMYSIVGKYRIVEKGKARCIVVTYQITECCSRRLISF